MAASHKLLQLPNSGKSLISKSGVLTIHGFGVRVRVHSGHLEIEDGVAQERRTIRLARVGHGLKRLVCISEDGFTTLGALNWLAKVGVSFVMLNRTGKVLFVTGPNAPSDARLRRAQALAFGNGIGLEISRTLIDAKLRSQERLMREGLKDLASARLIASFREGLPEADTIEVIRRLEAHAAISYFGSWRNIAVRWSKADLPRVPEHWYTVGSRHSPLSGGPRLAITPVHAIFNYCFALLESETRLALSALGLLPELGLGLHTDTPNRDSLALDVLEPVRPELESWVFRWITGEYLRRSDFFETTTGNCRLMTSLCVKLSLTAPIWGKLVAPWAEYVARTLWNTTTRPKSGRSPATPLTQQHRREAKGRQPFPTIEEPHVDSICSNCGKTIQSGRTNCAECAIGGATERLVRAARLGREAARSPEARAKHVASRRRHAQACSAWDVSKQPAWLTPEVFTQQIQPLLANIPTSSIRLGINVSRWYAGKIRRGYRPHPRHWRALARLAGWANG